MSSWIRERFVETARKVGTWLEHILAGAILIGVVVYGYVSATVLVGMDWRNTETFYELIYRVLLLVIAVELVRTLITHDLIAILELLAFVIARKMLKPELEAVEIVMSVVGFVALLAARWYFLGAKAPAGTLRRPESSS